MRKLSIVLILALLACSKHNDPPSPLDVNEPPTPANFTVSNPAPGIYDLAWDISDPAVVKYFNLYYLDPYTGPVFADTTAATSIQVNVGVAVSGLTWGVSSVSISNIEGRIVYASD
jgi:hypothetical protein